MCIRDSLSIVAVFLPTGFMEGIIGKFFHEFGITIVAAVMISMFVSFTLDPMLSSIWHDPSIEAHGKHHAPVTVYDKTIGRVTGWFERSTDQLAEGYQTILAWSLAVSYTHLDVYKRQMRIWRAPPLSPSGVNMVPGSIKTPASRTRRRASSGEGRACP